MSNSIDLYTDTVRVDHFKSVQDQCNESLNTIQTQNSLISQLEADLTRIRPYLPPRAEAEVSVWRRGSVEYIDN